MEDAEFVRATAADLPAIRDLLQRCGLPAEDLRPAHLERFFVCRADDQVAGTVGIELLGEIGLVRSLAVAPELRGRRLAHALWTRAHDEAHRIGLRVLYLLTTTAAGLFSRWGFRPVARDVVPDALRATSEFSSLCPSSATVMALDLRAHSDQRTL